jgi:hypothetical protein
MIKPIVEQYVKLYRSDDPKRISVPVKTDWKDDDRLLIIKPEAHLSPSSRYCLSIENLNARDRFGNALAEAIQEEFLTGNTIPSLQKAQHVQYDSVSKTLSWDGVPGADGYELWLFYGNEKERHDRKTAQHHILTPSHYPSQAIDCLVLPYKNFSGDVKGYSEEAVNSKTISIPFRDSAPLVFGVRIAGDRDNRITNTLIGLLKAQNYGIASERGDYTIVGEISTRQEERDMYYVSSSITLHLENNARVSRVLYAKSPFKGGSLRKDWNIALNSAFREIEKDLKTNFIEELLKLLED